MAFNIPQLQQYIAKGETGEAINILIQNTQNIRSQQLRSEVLQLASRWNSYLSTHRMGTQNHETMGVEQRQINQALLGLLSAIEEDQNGSSPMPPPQQNKWKRYAAIAAAVIAVLAGIAEFTGISLSDLLKKEPPPTTTTDTTKEEENPADQVPAIVEKTTIQPTDPPARSTPTPTASPDQLLIETKTNKGRGPAMFTSGETMRAYYQVNRPCLLRVIYQLADGRLILFENDREITQAQVGQFIELGDGYEAAEPFGQEHLYFFVQSEPFPKLTTELSVDGYLEIKDGLDQSLRKTRGMKKKNYFAEAALEIETKQ